MIILSESVQQDLLSYAQLLSEHHKRRRILLPELSKASVRFFESWKGEREIINPAELLSFLEQLARIKPKSLKRSGLLGITETDLYKSVLELETLKLLSRCFSDLITSSQPVQFVNKYIEFFIAPSNASSSNASSIDDKEHYRRVSFTLLDQHGLVNERTFDNLRHCDDPSNLAKILNLLIRTDSLTGLSHEDTGRLFGTIYLQELYNLLEKADSWGLLSRHDQRYEHLNIILKRFICMPVNPGLIRRYSLRNIGDKVKDYGVTLGLVESNGLLAGDMASRNFMLISGQNASQGMGLLIFEPWATDLQKNLSWMSRANLLTQENLDWLFSPHVLDILQAPNVQALWDRIPPHLLTAQCLEGIKTRCERYITAHMEGAELNLPGARQALVMYIERNILQIPPANTPQNNQGLFNAAQSTHTDSVHKSASTSAKKLKARYEEALNNKGGWVEVFGEINKWMFEQADSSDTDSRLKVAKTFISKISQDDHNFTDQTSGVSLKELVAYCWLGIHDDEMRLSTLDDAQKNFVDACYECQREYNLTEANVDTGGEDKPACVSGSFNKHIEKLQGIHKEMEIKFITPKTASFKFPIIVQEEAMVYISEKEKQLAPEEFSSFLSKIEEEGLAFFWGEIRNAVSERLIEEFGSLYPQGALTKNFIEMLETGEYVELKLESFKPKDESSESTFAASSSAKP